MGPLADKARGPLQNTLSEDSVSYVRFKASEALGKIGNVKAVPALVGALQDRQGYVCRGIATALGFLKDEKGKGAEALISILNNYLVVNEDNVISNFDGTERGISALSLGILHSIEAVPSLIVALNDTDWRVRMYSTLALGLIKDPSALSPLQALANDPNDIVKSASAWAIWRINNDPPEFPDLNKDKLYEYLRENGLLILIHD